LEIQLVEDDSGISLNYRSAIVAPKPWFTFWLRPWRLISVETPSSTNFGHSRTAFRSRRAAAIKVLIRNTLL